MFAQFRWWRKKQQRGKAKKKKKLGGIPMLGNWKYQFYFSICECRCSDFLGENFIIFRCASFSRANLDLRKDVGEWTGGICVMMLCKVHSISCAVEGEGSRFWCKTAVNDSFDIYDVGIWKILGVLIIFYRTFIWKLDSNRVIPFYWFLSFLPTFFSFPQLLPLVILSLISTKYFTIDFHINFIIDFHFHFPYSFFLLHPLAFSESRPGADFHKAGAHR